MPQTKARARALAWALPDFMPPPVEETKKDAGVVIPDSWAEFASLTKISSGGNVVNFRPYDYQIKIVELMEAQNFICVKSRQLGLSETVISYFLYCAIKNPGYLAAVFSKSREDTGLLAKRLRKMISSLNLKTTTDNIGDIELTTGGRILFRNSNPDSGRSLPSVTHVLLDEYSFCDHAADLFSAITPAQAMCGDKARVFIISTPNGHQGAFWDLLTNGQEFDVEAACKSVANGTSEGHPPGFMAWQDSGGWAKAIVHFKCHPVYGANPEKFLKDLKEKKKLSDETIQQEYNLSFISSDENYFQYDIVQGCIGELHDGSIFPPVCVLGIDPAFSSTGNDYCSASLLTYMSAGINVEIVYRRRHATSEFHIHKLTEIIDKNNITVVVIESNSGGVIFYENIKRQFPHLTVIAVNTSAQSKPGLLGRLTLELEKKSLRFKGDSPFVDELLSFRKIGNKLEASAGKNDDTILSTALGIAGLEKLELL